MARITIEDCLTRVENMYELVILATQRARQIYRGSSPLVQCKNKQGVTALREIADGLVRTTSREPTSETLDASDISAIAN